MIILRLSLLIDSHTDDNDKEDADNAEGLILVIVPQNMVPIMI